MTYSIWHLFKGSEVIFSVNLNFDYTLLFLVFMRMTGCLMLNPIFGRRNLPMIVKAGLSLILTIFTYNLAPDTFTLETGSVIIFGVIAIKEFIIGFIIGYIMNLFLSTIIVAGDLMDMQIGLSMSKIYDPASNVSMPVSASIVNVMLMVVFFLSNGHLTLIKIFTYSAGVIPFGEFSVSPEVYKQLALMFQTMLVYAMKMAMPVLAAEVIAEMSVGLMMKAVPQINIFAINIQLKVLVGFAMMFVLVPPFANFTERIIQLIFDNINNILAMI